MSGTRHVADQQRAGGGILLYLNPQLNVGQDCDFQALRVLRIVTQIVQLNSASTSQRDLSPAQL